MPSICDDFEQAKLTTRDDLPCVCAISRNIVSVIDDGAHP